ncbi:chlorophyll A-B binding protein [Aureococcus anophagefferens]|nr:chlorophyll A-B binding protein [Aureococcus anophagefferens]
MAGFVGYCLHANGVQFPIHIPGDYSTKSPAELWDQMPEAGKWQIILFVGFLEFWSESGAGGAHYTKGGKPGAFPSFNSPAAGDEYKIPHPVPGSVPALSFIPAYDGDYMAPFAANFHVFN